MDDCKAGACVTKETQTAQELDILTRNCDRLQDLLMTLSDTLSQVLRDPDPPPPSTDEKSEMLVPIAHRIRLLSEGIALKTEMVRDLIDRIEV